MLLNSALKVLPTTTSIFSIIVGSCAAQKKVRKLTHPSMAANVANFSPNMSSKANHDGVEGQSKINFRV